MLRGARQRKAKGARAADGAHLPLAPSCRLRCHWGSQISCWHENRGKGVLRLEEMRIDIGGKSHQIVGMATLTLAPEKQTKGSAVVGHYDIAADAKNRISLRGAKTKYFHVKAFANGCYVLVPRLLMAPQGLSARSLKMLDKSVAQLKKGWASAPIDLSAFFER